MKQTKTHNYRLCTVIADKIAVLEKVDASLVKKTLTAKNALHLDTKVLITKVNDVAKTVDLDVSMILTKEIKNPRLRTVHSSLRNKISSNAKSPEVQQSKGLLRLCQEVDWILIEKKGQMLSYNEPYDNLEDKNLRNSLQLSLFLACFRHGHWNEVGGHMRTSKTYNNAKRFYYWHGMFDWMCIHC